MINRSIEDDCHHRIVVNKSSLWSIEDILKPHHGTILIHFRWLWSNLGILSFGNLLLEKVFEKFRAAPRVCVFLSNKPVSSGHFVMNTVRVSTVIWSSRVMFLKKTGYVDNYLINMSVFALWFHDSCISLDDACIYDSNSNHAFVQIESLSYVYHWLCTGCPNKF